MLLLFRAGLTAGRVSAVAFKIAEQHRDPDQFSGVDAASAQRHCERVISGALEEFKGEIAVIVSSCDAFFDAWRPFAFFLRKHWPECPFPVYLVTNELQVRSEFIRGLPVGEDRGWAANMQAALAQIVTPWVLYFQEDYFLTRPVDKALLTRDIRETIDREAVALSFWDLSGLERVEAAPGERLMVVPRASEGRTRLQVTLWRRDVLAGLLKPGENA